MEIGIPIMGMGGLTCDMIFNKKQNLPEFASIYLFHQQKQQLIYDYCVQYINYAKEIGVNINLDTPTWRGNKDYIEKIGLTVDQMTEYHKRGVELLQKVMKDLSYQQKSKIIGLIGPRGDGYIATNKMSVKQAQDYHQYQVNIFKELNIKDINVQTLEYKQQALGIVNLCKKNNLNIVISFTVQTNGLLIDGSDYLETVKQIDEATQGYVQYFMINCSHPDHMRSIFQSSQNQIQKKRIKAIRVNSSKKSHAELDNCTELDIGNIQELAEQVKELHEMVGGFNQIGGCCGTDIRHIKAIFQAILPKK